MSGIKDQQNIEELRKKLYGRDFLPEETQRHSLSETKVDVSRGWANSTPRMVEPPRPVVERPSYGEVARNIPVEEPEPPKKKRSYRMIILLTSMVFFVLAALVSSVYLFFGANQISAKNITINVDAPFSVAAGDRLSMQVSVANQNSVPVVSATLILNYPVGTKTADDEVKDIYEERIPISSIGAGEALNLPINVILFGEENEEKEIKASIEYRVEGSNGTFYKEADPIKILVSSSPLVIRVSSVDKVSSGQEIELKITVQSNSSAPQKNILVAASYPNSFTFVSSDPEPSYAENEWLIDEIPPESAKVITLRGRVTGVENEQAEIQLTAGPPKSDNQFIMGSVLTKAKTSYTIEHPFIGVEVGINGDTDGSAIVGAGQVAHVIVKVTNTMSDTVYDMRVEVNPEGNLIRDQQLTVPTGFYDSSSKTITYEVAGMKSLAEVKPGETREFFFTIKNDDKQNTASFDISTKVFARRINEPNAAEEVIGTAISQAKYSSSISIASQAGYSDGIFTDTGAVPPIADKPTTYTLTFVADSGVNDLSGTLMTTTLPQYVTWLDKYDGDGTVEYNPVAKQLRWNIGNMDANTTKQLQVQVSLLPSVTQVGRTLSIVGTQELKATDSFTGVSLKDESLPISGELSTEAGFPEGNGRVVEGD